MKKQVSVPKVKVGILSAKEIKVDLLRPYMYVDALYTGTQTFTITPEGKIRWNDCDFEEISFHSDDDDSSYEVFDVVIGVNFHWERKETQRFKGDLKIIVENDSLTLVNTLSVEDYLMSVISSEMSATASMEFLKSHAVISRSWLLAQIDKNKSINESKVEYSTSSVSDNEIIKWYDREDHVNFDVCADDHCQRYQGITRQTTPTVKEAVETTKGLVLTDCDDKLCDTRFSKCCGGVFEQFENCWEPKHYHYLVATRDGADETDFPDLTREEYARKWILGRPKAYCNTSDRLILSQVLNNFDQETTDFYRWDVSYTQDELSEIIRRRSGIDFGAIIALEPLERGTSGRLVRLRIVGSKKTMIIGKELEIRRTLSNSHLYSSAFIVETSEHDENNIPGKFTLRGAGWGHGVGLCQIGAAVMGAKGSDFRQILSHYFPGSKLTDLY